MGMAVVIAYVYRGAVLLAALGILATATSARAAASALGKITTVESRGVDNGDNRAHDAATLAPAIVGV